MGNAGVAVSYRFCPYCGARVDGARFCSNCGRPLAAERASTPLIPTPASPKGRTGGQAPKRVSAQILGSLHKWVYLVAGLLAIVSIFLPWWSLHAEGGSVVTNRGIESVASFDFGLGPTGASISVQLTGRSVPI